MAGAEPLNEVRFEAYHKLARAFFFQTHNMTTAATMMLDVRFPEVPRAFASALVAAAAPAARCEGRSITHMRSRAG